MWQSPAEAALAQERADRADEKAAALAARGITPAASDTVAGGAGNDSVTGAHPRLREVHNEIRVCWRIENPRVGGSNPPPGAILLMWCELYPGRLGTLGDFLPIKLQGSTRHSSARPAVTWPTAQLGNPCSGILLRCSMLLRRTVTF